jgi:hypothetical protein
MKFEQNNAVNVNHDWLVISFNSIKSRIKSFAFFTYFTS